MVKNLKDAIHGDRADIRGFPVKNNGDDDTDWWKAPEYQQHGIAGVLPFKGGSSKTTSHSSSGKYTNYSSCYETHPALKIPGTELVIRGGNCDHPVLSDVHIGFAHSMKWTARHWPWKKGAEVLFSIQDMGVPNQPDEFKKLVSWTAKQLQGGLSVHCGCMGGHGRTGMFLAALVKHMSPETVDAISYVRQNYCVKAVESSAQVRFLNEHFGIKKVEGYKDHLFKDSHHHKGKKQKKGKNSGGKEKVWLTPMDDQGNIWKKSGRRRG